MVIYIYLIKSKLNNKCYIGQTIDYKKRTKEHIYGRNSNKNSIIDRAIKKHGKDMFEFSVIDYATNQDDADELERKYIQEYNSLKPNGYNILIGGRNQQGSWNQKKVYMYDLNGNYLGEFESSMDVERKSNSFYLRHGVSDCCNGKNKRYKDKIFSYIKESKIKSYKKPKSVRNKKVYQFSKNGRLINVFESIACASLKTNTLRTSIIGCLKGNYKTANGYLWSYSKECSNIDLRIKRISIYQCDKYGNVINTFPSCKEAERFLKLKEGSYKNIYSRLDKNKIAYGFYWKRINKDNHVPSL